MPYEDNRFRAGSPWTPQQLHSARVELEHKELLSGRPDRQTIINQDDIINLQIALHKSESLEDFLTKV